MSSSLGKVRFKDGTVKYFRYNGTSDYCVPNLYDTKEECTSNWRKEYKVDWDKAYYPEPVEIATCYGKGYGYLGYKKDPLEAHKVWQESKKQLFIDILPRYEDPVVKKGIERVIRMLEDDIKYGKETMYL